jgi:hypothetical protein
VNSTFNALSINSPTPTTARPFATGAGRWLARAGGTLLKALQASSEARARQHILAFATRCEGLQPELAKELRVATRQFPAA